MSELEPSQEFNNKKPFIIKGHHLPVFSALIEHRNFLYYSQEPVMSPESLAKHIRSKIETGSKKYAHDVFGPSSESAGKVEEYLTQAFATFLALPKNYPAEVVEEMPDAICKGCYVGEHCRKKESSEKDGKYLDAFIIAAKFFYSNKLSIVKEKFYFSDAKPQKVRKAKTTIGLVKDILEKKLFELQ